MKFIRYGDLKAFDQKQYTSMRDFERALRRAEPKAYGKQRASRTNAKASRFGGPYCYNATIALEGMYEVFFDEEDIKKIT